MTAHATHRDRAGTEGRSRHRADTGDDTAAPRRMLPFAKAKSLLRLWGITSRSGYFGLPPAVREQSGLPLAPDQHYRDEGWQGWADFLADRSARFVSFDEARALVRALGIRSAKRYFAMTLQTLAVLRLPSQPRSCYVGQWQGWAHFLGRSGADPDRRRLGIEHCSYEEARKIAIELGVRTAREYHGLSTAVLDAYRLPSRPDVRYADQWPGWKKFLYFPKPFPPYDKAKAIVRAHGINTLTEYRYAIRRGLIKQRLPLNPYAHYQGAGWTSAADFFGAGARFVPFAQAKRIVRELGLRSSLDYRNLSKAERRRHRLPSSPTNQYATTGWAGWVDFLGLEHGRFLPYEHAAAIAPTLGPRTSRQWRALDRKTLRRLGLPATPDAYYAGAGWVSWAVFLGRKPAPESA